MCLPGLPYVILVVVPRRLRRPPVAHRDALPAVTRPATFQRSAVADLLYQPPLPTTSTNHLYQPPRLMAPTL